MSRSSTPEPRPGRPTTSRSGGGVSRRSLLGGVATAGTALAAGRRLRQPATAAAAPENVRVSQDAFTMHAETNLAVNPREPRNLVGACIVSKDAQTLLATYASFDGGATWQSNGELPTSDDGRDPTVAFDGAGHGFVCGSTANVSVWRTDDGGRSFGDPVAITNEHIDHPWLAVDPSPSPATGDLYVVYSAGTPNLTKLGFARSTDGGRGFETPRTIAEEPDHVIAGPMVAAGPDGAVYAIYSLWPPAATGSSSKSNSARRSEVVAPIRVVCSTDHGRSFGEPIELGQGATEVEVSAGATSPAAPTIAADRQRGTVYAAFVIHQSGADRTDLAIAVSSDRGRTWSAATPVTSGTDRIFYFQPQLAVDEAGRVALSAFALAEDRVDVVLAIAEPDTLQFAAPVRVTTESFDPARGSPAGGGKHGAWWIGDYQGLASTLDGFFPFWNDTRTGQLELFTAMVPGR
jgi:hypothetical protein